MASRSRKKKKPTLTKAPTPARRWPWLLVLVAIALAGVWLTLGGRQNIPAGAFEGRNLLLVTIDTIRVDRLGSYGGTEGLTPNLDRLAAEGIRFEHALAHVPVTLPSHSSILTGRYPVDHGVHDNGTFRLDASLPTLATVLKDTGYRTGAFVSAFVLDARFGLNRGFDVYDDYYGEKREILSFQQLERSADAVVAPAEKWIREQRNPWFAWVHFFDPHTPYASPRSFPGTDAYGEEVAYTDYVLGRFLDRLDLTETLVVIVGDHGESLGDHGEKTHGTFAYNSTLRIPWILWAADGLKPQVFGDTVRHVDVMPTVLDFLGLEAPGGVRGRSLRPYLNGERYSAPESYFEALNPHLTRDWAPLRGIVEGGRKLISLPIPELYDLERDPRERTNIYKEEPDVAARLEQKLAELTGGEDTIDVAPADAETVERLRALGYITAPTARRTGEYSVDDDPKRLVDVSNAYDDVTELFNQGQFAEALPILEGLVERRPQSSEAYRGLAYALRQTGRLGDAIATLERGVEKGVQDTSLLGTLSAYLLDAGEVPKAVGLLEALVRREPDYAEGHNYLGIAYGRLGRFDESRAELERVLELDPSSASAYNNLGRLAMARGDVDEAIRVLNEALKFDAGNANTHNGLGVAHARRGDMSSAVTSWKRSVELNPGQFDALFNLAMTLSEISPREALPYLRRFASEAPSERYATDIARARSRIHEIESP